MKSCVAAGQFEQQHQTRQGSVAEAIPATMPVWDARARPDVKQLQWDLGNCHFVIYNLQLEKWGLQQTLQSKDAELVQKNRELSVLRNLDATKGHKIHEMIMEKHYLKYDLNNKIQGLQEENQSLQEENKGLKGENEALLQLVKELQAMLASTSAAAEPASEAASSAPACESELEAAPINAVDLEAPITIDSEPEAASAPTAAPTAAPTSSEDISMEAASSSTAPESESALSADATTPEEPTPEATTPEEPSISPAAAAASEDSSEASTSGSAPAAPTTSGSGIGESAPVSATPFPAGTLSTPKPPRVSTTCWGDMLEEEGSRPTSPLCLPSWALSKEEEQEQADKQQQQQQQQEAAPAPKGPTTPLRRAGGRGTFSRAVADL